MAVNLADCGVCIETHVIRDNFEFQEKTYQRDDAIQLRKDAFSAAQILQGQAQLEGAVTDNSLVRVPLVTWHEDVKDTVPLHRLNLKPKIKSKANSSAGAACGFWGGSSEQEEVYRFLTVQRLVQDEEYCVDELIKTYMTKGLRRGVNQEGQLPVDLQAEVVYSNMKASSDAWDYHAWGGDYKSQDASRLHVDGFVKIAYQAISGAVAPVYRWTFSALTAAGRVAVAIGGKIDYHAFDTNLATTLSNIATYYNTTFPPVDGNGVAQFASVTAGATTLTFTGLPGVKIPYGHVQVVVAAAATTAEFCNDTLTANTAVSGETATFSEVTAASGGQQPITIPVAAITSGTDAWNQLNALHEEIGGSNPALLDLPGFYYAVAPNVYNALVRYYAEKGVSNAVSTEWGKMQTNFIGKAVIPMRFMKQHGIYASHADALHCGTDLTSDISAIEVGFERKCGDSWVKNRYNMGFQISHLKEFAGTLTNGGGALAAYHAYQAAGPDRLVQ